jgi:hypothetical protein
VVSPGPKPPRRAKRVCGVLGHTLSSGNVREAQRLHVARVTFPQRLHSGTPLRGRKKPKRNKDRNLRHNVLSFFPPSAPPPRQANNTYLMGDVSPWPPAHLQWQVVICQGVRRRSGGTPPLWRRYSRGSPTYVVAGDMSLAARTIILRKKASIIISWIGMHLDLFREFGIREKGQNVSR